MNLQQEIRSFFSVSGNAIRRIILINVCVFVLFGLVNLLLFLSNTDGTWWTTFTRYLMLPASFSQLGYQPWSFITYMFLHESFFHILFNMLWLYWIGSILEEYLGNRKVYEAYLSGGVFGGLIYIIAYSVFPVFQVNAVNTFAIGASASVLAIVFATATLLPDYGIHLLFFGNVKLKWLALISVILDLISIPNGNAGGHIAHIGGALAGFLYIRFLYKRGGHLFPDWLFKLFEPRSRLKVHSVNKEFKQATQKLPSQGDVDAILDKISKSGYDSLSKREKEILFKASKD